MIEARPGPPPALPFDEQGGEEQQREERPSAAPFLLVTGGKGGVGKTTVAVNLGLALSQNGLDPLLVDLDFGLANLDVLLGLEPRRNVETFFNGEASLESCVEAGPESLRVLCAGSGSPAMCRPDPQRFESLSQGVRALPEVEVVVGDSAAGIGEEVLSFAAAADRVLVVTTPDPPAVTDAYGVIKALDHRAAETGAELPTPDLFVNFASDAAEARSVADKLRTVCERFLSRSPRLFGWMPRSRSVLLSVIESRPFVLGTPRSSAAQSLHRLARRYVGALDLRSRPRPSSAVPAKGLERDGR